MCMTDFKNVFITMVLLGSSALLTAQTTLWEKTYGGKHAEFLYDALATPDYGYILAGSSLSNKSGDKTQDNIGDLDFWLWKMNEAGELDWQKSFGGSGSDQLISIQLTADAGYILAGTSESPAKDERNTSSCKTEPNYGLEDFWILKLNAFGAIEWQKTLGGVAQDKVTQILPTKDGGYLVGGSSASGKTGNKTTDHHGALDYWILKLNIKGEIVWQRTFGGQYNDELKSMALTADGGFLIGGISNSPQSGNKMQPNLGGNDYWIIKTDNQGNEQWQTVLGGKRDDQLSTLLALPNGNYLAGGNTTSKNEDKNSDLWVMELDKQGNIQWEQTYDFDAKDVLTTLLPNQNNTFIIGAYTNTAAQVKTTGARGEVSGFRTLCIDAQGNTLWETQHSSPGTDILRKVIETRDGSYLLAGTRKYNSNNHPSFGGEGGGLPDFYVLKQKDNQKQTFEKQVLEALPNPTDAFTNVVIGEAYTHGTLTVYDLAGRQLQQTTLTGLRTIPVNLSSYPEGIYLLEAETNNQKASVKIIKK